MQDQVYKGAEKASGEWKGVQSSWESGSLKHTLRGRLRPDPTGHFNHIKDLGFSSGGKRGISEGSEPEK